MVVAQAVGQSLAVVAMARHLVEAVRPVVPGLREVRVFLPQA